MPVCLRQVLHGMTTRYRLSITLNNTVQTQGRTRVRRRRRPRVFTCLLLESRLLPARRARVLPCDIPTSEHTAGAHCPLTLLYPSQLTCSVTFCFCGVEQGGRHSYSGRSRRSGRWVICKICNTTLFTILSILSFFANFVEHRRVFSRPEDGLTDIEDIKGGIALCI